MNEIKSYTPNRTVRTCYTFYMKKSILITGVGGSGKSTIARQLNKGGYRSYDIEDIDGLFKMVDKKTGEKNPDYSNDNIKHVQQHDWICDVDKLKKLIEDESGDLTFYCGIASNMEDLVPLFNVIILLKASPETTRKRLSSREAGEYGNTKEAQEHLLGWKDGWEQKMQELNAVVVNADKSPTEVLKDIESLI